MKTKITREYTFTKEEVEKVLTEYVALMINEPDRAKVIKNVSWSITEGDRGIKDPMDYSPYQPTEVKEVVVKL